MKKNNLVLNNKGYMLVETIVASVIAFVIAYFLIDISIKMVSKNDDFYLTSVLQTDQSLITKEIMDDFNNYTVTGVTCNSPVGDKCSSATISFEEIASKTLSVSGNTVTYGNYKKTFDNMLGVGELSFYANNEILYISLPAYTNYSDKNYGLNISIKYDPTITDIQVPSTSMIEVTDEFLNDPKNYTKINSIIEYEYSCTNSVKTLDLPAGKYTFKVWGAQGGSYDSTYIGGKGGYSKGEINLIDEITTLYIHVGCQPSNPSTSTGTNSGGFNGGGTGHSSVSSTSFYGTSNYGAAGGGASDIRIGNDNLYSRVIVAGGGSGAKGTVQTVMSSNNTSGTSGYYGGGLTSGGSASSMQATISKAGTSGSFGTGASSTSSGKTGGGGGWYGGGVTGGGSGWAYTESNFETWKQSDATNANEYELTSKYYLENVEIKAGNESFADYDGATVTGVSGSGYVLISGNGETIRYKFPRITSGLNDLVINQGKSYDLTSDIEIECAYGETQCSLVNFSIDGESTINTSNLDVGNYVVNYIIESQSGQKYLYRRNLKVIEEYVVFGSQISGSNTLTLDAGIYLLEVWGAQGGSYNATYAGGKGGYSKGTLTLNNSTTVYIYVGGEGASGTSSTGTIIGGTNGGGNSFTYNSSAPCSAGGGASDIRIGEDSLYARVIVAGGGGGSCSYNTSARFSGGSGGGTTGSAGGQYSTSYPAGTGGGVDSPGISYYNTTANSTTYGTLAAFGTGASVEVVKSSYGMSGGGGGWYGGGYGTRSGGGGGSGYVYTSTTATNYPSGCLLNASYYLTNAETISGNEAFTDFDGSTVTGHSGSGAVRITRIG